jgi:hypothetical protein
VTAVAWQAEPSHPMSLKPQGSFDRPKAAGRVMGAVSRASLGQPASVERLEGLAEAVSTGWMLRAGQLAEISLASVRQRPLGFASDSQRRELLWSISEMA